MYRILLSITLLVTLFGCASSETKSVETPTSPETERKDVSTPKDEKANIFGKSDFVLGVGDVMDIYVYRHDDLSLKSVRIRPDGKISYPLIGSIHAGGLTITDLENRLTDELGRYIVNPKVVINPETISSQINPAGKRQSAKGIPEIW